MTLKELNEQEHKLFIKRNGHIPEADDELNDLQRQKIQAVYDEFGCAYMGKFNYYDENRKNLTAEDIYIEYKEQMICNFGADFVVPIKDEAFANMIIEWNQKTPTSLKLIERITHRADELNGTNLIWS